jgi:hypothetical protein
MTRVLSHLALMVKFKLGTDKNGKARKRMMQIVLIEDNSASGCLFSQLEWKNQHGLFYCYPFSITKRMKGALTFRLPTPS